LPIDTPRRLARRVVAPVLLISAMNARLERIVDRRRVIQGRAGSADDRDAQNGLELLARRSRLVYFAIFCVVSAALLVCLVVAGAFLGARPSVDLARMVAALFIGAMLAMIAGLDLFLREVYLAVRTGSHERR
jgi:hypothetical protein